MTILQCYYLRLILVCSLLELVAPTLNTTLESNSTSTNNRQLRMRERPFRKGHLSVYVPSLGIRMSTGMRVKILAHANRKVRLVGGKLSSRPFHSMPDGAAVLPLSNGGYVYVSNSEMADGYGGVYGVYFDSRGRVVDYKRLLKGTTRNCSGGTTPWNTWISCEEYSRGQCWQVDPDPDSENFEKT